MRKYAVLLSPFILCVAAAIAQSEPAVPAQGIPGQEAGTSQRGPIVLKSGTPISLRNKQSISSQHRRVGDEIEFSVAAPVVIDGLVVIPQLGKAKGKVVGLKRPRSFNRNADIRVEIEEVQLVTRQTIKLRGKVEKLGGNETGTVLKSWFADMGVVAVPFVPFLVTEKGLEVEIDEGSRFQASIAGDHVLDRKLIENAQVLAAIPTDVAYVYVYRPKDDGDTGFSLGIACGNLGIGGLEAGEFVRLELPPATYWLSLDSQFQIMTDRYLVDPKSVLQLDVAGGYAYYLHGRRYDSSVTPRSSSPHLESVDVSTGMAEIAEAARGREHTIRNTSLSDMIKLVAQPELRATAPNSATP